MEIILIFKIILKLVLDKKTKPRTRDRSNTTLRFPDLLQTTVVNMVLEGDTKQMQALWRKMESKVPGIILKDKITNIKLIEMAKMEEEAE